jgi:hypothetical protein
MPARLWDYKREHMFVAATTSAVTTAGSAVRFRVLDPGQHSRLVRAALPARECVVPHALAVGQIAGRGWE